MLFILSISCCSLMFFSPFSAFLCFTFKSMFYTAFFLLEKKRENQKERIKQIHICFKRPAFNYSISERVEVTKHTNSYPDF